MAVRSKDKHFARWRRGGRGPGGTEAGGGSVKEGEERREDVKIGAALEVALLRRKGKEKERQTQRTGFSSFFLVPSFFSRCRRGISDCAERRGLWAWRGENPTADIFICSPLKAVLVGALPQRGELVG